MWNEQNAISKTIKFKEIVNVFPVIIKATKN